ncbi:Smr domain (Small MutS Related) containing protein [Paraglaciecola mesophila KMM 241]|uniref:Smr domain (Small MutS Related) containing protein n=1 Tax=Paraglaciecola mesophila KMM 241 TaxID=1128912 RepID=K6ZNL7_9ALTE|nr:DNA endonuclease SmrA [Paraglaciecola mesophila]GAC24940.1 Smr domain (Small MutS Related) containing protein [Paraglaciecola mesophila KMM 241]
MSFDEECLEDDFLSAMSDVTPLGPDDRVSTTQAEKTLAQQLRRKALEQQLNRANNFLSSEITQLVAPDDMLGFKQDGVQEGVYKNLRLGKYPIDDVLNLHTGSFEKSRQLLFDAIMVNQAKGVRCMLIKHGRGEQSKPIVAYLKSAVNHWLLQLPQVIAFHSAQIHHGGSASVYALLKKSEQQKDLNRELHRKK